MGFLFNLDESGGNQFVDARKMNVSFPKNKDVETYLLIICTKRTTPLHCTSTDGTYCDPLIIIPRLTFDNEIFN